MDGTTAGSRPDFAAPFSIARLPRIEFGAGSAARLPEWAASFGRRLLVVTGARSFEASAHAAPLWQGLRGRGCEWELLRVGGEPTPAEVDAAVQRWRSAGIEAVLAIGGGSVLDAGKAVAGLLPSGRSVLDHLEGVGPELAYEGPATPLIAVPTTAGTGSEATKNAVLSRLGPAGFKKSFRADALVPQLAVVDPQLLQGCPPPLIAANGMDAFTQLLESYVSSRANPWTDALAWSGLQAVCAGLLPWHRGGPGAAAARAAMAYASLVSGICLAQTGLGSVHGLASPLGAFFPIAHGVVCGTLVAAAARVNILALEQRAPNHPALGKYAAVGRLLAGQSSGSDTQDRQQLVQQLHSWTSQLQLPSLAALGVSAGDMDRIVAASRGSSMKTNPIVLTDDEIRSVLAARLQT